MPSAMHLHPKPADVLICDFDRGGFVPPEMVKRRPVIVISRADTHGRGLCTVVPLSTTAPFPVHPWHYPMPHLALRGWQAKAMIWAKADMLCTVAFDRLDRPHFKTRHGRTYQSIKVSDLDMATIRAGIRAYLEL